MDNIFECPICGDKRCVPIAGSKNSPILIVGEFPGWEEVKKGRPAIGKIGDVLNKELGMLGIDLKRLRIGNLWHHAKNGDEKCLQYGAEQIVKEVFLCKELVLLMGSDSVSYFTGKSVSDVSSMMVQSTYWSVPTFCMVNPAQVFRQGVGEVRLALQKFARYIEKENLLL